MREGARRLVAALRVVGWVWLIGTALYLVLGDERLGDSLLKRAMVGALIVAPGYVLIGIAWILDGFAKDWSGSRS